MSFLSVITAAALAVSAFVPVPAASSPGAVPPTVSAKGCVVIDSLSGDVLFSCNENERLPMASTTKIMSAYIALREPGLDTPFTVDSEAIKVEGSSMGLREGDTVTLRDLVCGMLLPSGNDAANAAAVRISGSIPAFVGRMNACAEELGLKDTHFVTPSGLDDYTDEHYSTALDMARLTRAALRLDSFREICSQKTVCLEIGDKPEKRWLTNTNRLLSQCGGCIGVKTGFTDKAGRCLVSACEREGVTLICVTLNDRDDWRDHSVLYDYCFSQLESVQLTPKREEYVIPSAVRGDEPVRAVGESAQVLLPAGAAARLRRVTLIAPFTYGTSAGEQVGRTDFYLDGRLYRSLPVIASSG
ncbi:MAG: D-alanyl-D-alanine carboxypeptidase [Ruminococcus sp.]|nr:D-alanyl-D-alanine carboxypeptidase [Ruminococcus sp.]